MTLQLDQEEIFQSSSKIHYSASSGDLKSLECLVETGCDVNSLDADGQTPLHLVVKAAEDELHVACLTYLLAQKNLELNVPDRWGCTPVHWAAVQVCFFRPILSGAKPERIIFLIYIAATLQRIEILMLNFLTQLRGVQPQTSLNAYLMFKLQVHANFRANFIFGRTIIAIPTRIKLFG